MPIISAKNLANPRLLAILFLGFSSGLPLALTSSTLQAWFTSAHINVVTVGALTLLGIPYTLKFLWAPLMDHYSLSWFDKRRSWILLTQFGVFITLILLAGMDPSLEATRMGVIALVVAFFAASQDVAIDAYRTDVLKVEERGIGASYFVFAFRLAMLLSGGLALVCADYIGWKSTYEIMAFLILLSMIVVYYSPEVDEKTLSLPHWYQTVLASWRDLLLRDRFILLLLFIVFYKFGDAFALSLITNFLLNGLGFSLTEVGVAYKFTSFIATVLGCFVGGLFLIRWNIYRALLIFGLAQAFSNLMFVLLAIAGKQFFLMASSIFIENFCSGLSTAALLSFLMSLCNHKYSAAQYALLSAFATAGRIFLGPIAGLMVQNLGWVQLFIWSFIMSFPGIILLMLLKEKVLYHAAVIAD